GVAPGHPSNMNVIANANPTTGAPALPGATTVFVELQIRDSAHAAPNIFDGIPLSYYYGVSQEFHFTLVARVTYPPLYCAAGDWPPGTYNLDQSSVGSLGAIMVGIPEPSSFALAGLAAAGMLLFRRRK